MKYVRGFSDRDGVADLGLVSNTLIDLRLFMQAFKPVPCLCGFNAVVPFDKAVVHLHRLVKVFVLFAKLNPLKNSLDLGICILETALPHDNRVPKGSLLLVDEYLSNSHVAETDHVFVLR